jgi:hypothetical protein
MWWRMESTGPLEAPGNLFRGADTLLMNCAFQIFSSQQITAIRGDFEAWDTLEEETFLN